MYCRKCGSAIEANQLFCNDCQEEEIEVVFSENKPAYWDEGFIVALLSLFAFVPIAWPAWPFLAIIGLVLGIKSKRVSTIIMSVVSLTIFILFFIVWMALLIASQ